VTHPFTNTAARRAAAVAAIAGLVPLAALTPSSAADPALHPPRGPGAAPRPTLVVLVTIDQFRADYLDRFAAGLEGGLARLVRGGARFTNAHQDHAIPETAPGHATLLSGRFPRSTRIILNGVGVDDPEAPLLDGSAVGASPRRFKGTALFDWMRARDSRSHALSVSGKDRGAILPLGRAKEEAYWYGFRGRFTTSRYYRDKLPEWVQQFNARDLARRRAGQSWAPLLDEQAYPESDTESIEGGGHDVRFPHVAPADSDRAAAYAQRTPWSDEIVLALALEGLQARKLGTGPQADLLSVSLSATDAIGHVYGPDSREMHDQVLRLDRALGVFLDSLYKLRDSTRIAVVLAADHGAAPIPEISMRQVRPEPMRVETEMLLATVRQGLRAARVDTTAIDLALGLVIVDREALARGHIDADSMLEAFAKHARASRGVQRVDRLRDLRAANLERDPVARRWAHLLPEDVPVDWVVTLAPYNIWWSDNVASHHTPHDYDTHIPLIFYGPSFAPGAYADFVRSVDIAPTLAQVLELRPAEKLDGVVLKKALR